MIDFELSFQYENESVPALRTVSGSIKEGSCIVLCGGSGCGKTTLLRCMNRLIPTFYEGNLRVLVRSSGRIPSLFLPEKWEKP